MVIVAIVAFVVVLVVALLSFIRSARLESELTALKKRIDELERPRAPLPSFTAAAVQAPIEPAVEPGRRTLPPPPAVTHEPALDLEERIGGRWLQHAGMMVLVLGVAFFLRYAFDRDWLSPAVRIALGAIVGLGLAAGGVRLARRYRAYGLFLSGGGLAVLYLSAYAGLNLYDFFGPVLACALLVAITVAAAALADRTNSLGLALMAVGGGFATPFLVGGGYDHQLTLFTYVAILLAATTYLAHRRTWPWLNVASLMLTAVTVLAWAIAFYTPATYLRTELFLTLYCAMSIDIIRKAWQSPRQDPALMFFLLLAPAGYHVWSIVALAPHELAFLIYVMAFTLVMALGASRYRSSLLRLIAWLGVAVPLGVWIGQHHWQGWIVATAITTLAVYVTHAAVHARAMLIGEALDERDIALLHANGVGVFAALFAVLTDSASNAQLSLLAIALAAGNGGLWAATRGTASIDALHWLGVASTLVAMAIWLQFGGPWAVVAWATEGALVFWIAGRARRDWMRAGACVLFAIGVYRWLQGDIQDTTTSHVVIANARALTGLYVTALLYVAAWLQHRQGDAAEEPRRLERAGLLVVASVLTLFVMSTEIVSFWAIRAASPYAYTAREMMLSASWVTYAALLVVIGMRRHYAPIRYFAIALFGVSLVKVFLVDLGTLAGIYRVVGFLVVGLILLIVSFLYQRGDAVASAKPSE